MTNCTALRYCSHIHYTGNIRAQTKCTVVCRSVYQQTGTLLLTVTVKTAKMPQSSGASYSCLTRAVCSQQKLSGAVIVASCKSLKVDCLIDQLQF